MTAVSPQNKAQPQGGSAKLEERAREIDFPELARRLWRRKALILGTVILVMALTILITVRLTPHYSAEVLIMLDPRERQVVDVEAVLSGLSADSETIRSEIEVISSRGLAAKVIDALRLEQDREFNQALRPPSPWLSWVDLETWIPEPWRPAFGFFAIDGLPPDQEMARERARVIDALLENLTVSARGRSRVIRIAFESENPRRAAKVVNSLADFYLVNQLETKFEANQRANRWLSERLAVLRRDVEEAERAGETFRQSSGLIRGKDATLASQQISELTTQLVIEQTKRAESVARLRQVERLVASSQANSVSEVLGSPLIQRLREQEAKLVGGAAELAIEYGDMHPKMINARAEIRDLEQKIRLEVARIVEALRNDATVARAREASLKRELSAMKAEMGLLKKSEVKLRALERESTASRMLFENFLARSKEINAQASFQEADASIISRADVPEIPSFPNLAIILGIGLVGSSLLGTLLALGVEQFDAGFRSSEQIERSLQIAALGLVPELSRLGKAGRNPAAYLLARPSSAYAEAIRSLHTRLLLAETDGPPKTLLVASALPKEGKTSVVASLALLMANIGHRVVVVDCDLCRPTAHIDLDTPPGPGLVDWLIGRAELEQVIHGSRADGADLIPAGATLADPRELLGSDKMKALLAALGETYDLVILDSPPVMAVSDALILTRLVDKTLYIVRWAHTRRETTAAALKRLLEAGGEVAGILLTRVNTRRHARYGYGDSATYYASVRRYYKERDPR